MVRRYGAIALPFMLLGAGAVALYISPLPTILHLMIGGAKVRVVPTWRTAGLPALTALCWAAAIWLSLRIKPQA